MILFNPTEAPIRDYPIENPQTKEVSLWSILPGETLDFPDYVGEYLLYVYGFLQKVMTESERQAELEAQKKMSQGTHFNQIKIVAAEPTTVTPPETPNLGFTNEIINPAETPNPPPTGQTPVNPADYPDTTLINQNGNSGSSAGDFGGNQ